MSNVVKKQQNVGNQLLRFSYNIIEQLGAFATNNELTFSEEDKVRGVNALRTIEPLLLAKGLDWTYFNSPELRNNITSVLQQVIFLKVNPSVIPRECYFILRKTDVGDGVKKDFIEFGIEGAGNDAILRNFGVNVKQVKSYIVYEDDEFSGVIFDGFEERLPTYKPKMRKAGERKGKALYAVYLIQKNDGRVETSIAEREDVKQSLLAQIRQSNMFYDNTEELLTYLDTYTLDDILDNKLKNTTFTFKGKYGNKKVDVSELISPAWKSVVSREKMIERKMRNHATRRYPKDFTNKTVETLYENTFEEQYDAYGNVLVQNKQDLIGLSTAEFENEANKQEIPKEQPKKETPIKEQDFEVIVEEPIVVKEDEVIEEDVSVVEEEQQVEQELPEWML